MSARAEPLRITVATDLADFWDIWPSVYTTGHAALYVFQSREVLQVWGDTIGRARRAQPFFVRVTGAEDTPVLLLPLVIERRRGARVLTFPDGGVSDYNAPVLFPHASALEAQDVRSLWRRVLAALPPIDAVVFEKVPGEICGMANPLGAAAPISDARSGHCAILEGDPLQFERTRIHRAKDSRRKRRRLAEAGDVRFVVADTEAARARLLAAMIRQKTRRYLERDGVDGFDRPGYRAYFAEMTARHPSLVHLSALEVNGVPLATHWGLITPHRFYCLMLGFEDHPLALYSPGRLLVEDLINHCYERGVRAFDLGAGDAPWKALVGARAAPLRALRAPRSALGWAYLQASRLRAQAANRSGMIAVSAKARGFSKRGTISSQLRGGLSSAS